MQDNLTKHVKQRLDVPNIQRENWWEDIENL